MPEMQTNMMKMRDKYTEERKEQGTKRKELILTGEDCESNYSQRGAGELSLVPFVLVL